MRGRHFHWNDFGYLLDWFMDVGESFGPQKYWLWDIQSVETFSLLIPKSGWHSLTILSTCFASCDKRLVLSLLYSIFCEICALLWTAKFSPLFRSFNCGFVKPCEDWWGPGALAFRSFSHISAIFTLVTNNGITSGYKRPNFRCRWYACSVSLSSFDLRPVML